MSITSQLSALPSVAITETPQSFTIILNISDLHVDKTTVSLIEGKLVIDMKSEHQQGQSYYLGEMQSETFRRIIPLDFEASEKGIKTNCHHDVLEIRVPKPVIKKTTATVA